MTSSRYRPKFDWWQLLLVVGSPLALLVVVALGQGLPLALRVFAIVLAASFLWIALGTWYEVREAELVAAFGPFRFRYPWAHAFRVRKGGWWAQVSSLREPRTRLAFSTDNLILEFRRNGSVRRVVVSPQDQGRFLKEVKDRAPTVFIEGLEV